jgi:hypothetical protein
MLTWDFFLNAVLLSGEELAVSAVGEEKGREVKVPKTIYLSPSTPVGGPIYIYI